MTLNEAGSLMKPSSSEAPAQPAKKRRRILPVKKVWNSKRLDVLTKIAERRRGRWLHFV